MHPIMVACDVETQTDLDKLLENFKDEKPCLKIGMELFYFEGPAIVKQLKEKGYAVFLDLKLHDIPNTVFKALSQLAKLDVDYVTVHAAGGRAMLEAASKAVKGTNTKVLAVTLLTSLSQDAVTHELLLNGAVSDIATHYAKMAAEAGINGCICSPHEAQAILQSTNPSFLRICPGIRFASDAIGDQVRVATPAEAFKMGASSLVIGRSITQATDVAARFQEVIEEAHKYERN